MNYAQTLGERAKVAAPAIANASPKLKNEALAAIAAALLQQRGDAAFFAYASGYGAPGDHSVRANAGSVDGGAMGGGAAPGDGTENGGHPGERGSRRHHPELQPHLYGAGTHPGGDGAHRLWGWILPQPVQQGADAD